MENKNHTKGTWCINPVETLHFDVGVKSPLIKDGVEKVGFSFQRICRLDVPDYKYPTDYKTAMNEAEANAEYIVTACNEYGNLTNALARIALHSELALKKYADSKDVDWKTLLGAIVETAKNALPKN